MKKLLILLMAVTLLPKLSAQESLDNWYQRNEDKVNHFTVSFIVSTTTTGISYHWLSEYTDLHPILCKVTSAVIGLGSTVALGYIKEKNDPFFNPYDMEANKLGAIAGTLTFEIIVFRNISERRYKKLRMK